MISFGQCCARHSLRSRTVHVPERRSDLTAGIPGDPWGNEWGLERNTRHLTTIRTARGRLQKL
eukprot:scaffold9881_cov65-Cylindrotheca_fusiformis.AAC.1